MVYYSDSDSSEDFSVGGRDTTPTMVAHKKNKNKAAVVNIPDADVTQGSIDDRFAAIMSLKAGLGMDQDPDYLRQEEKRAALKREQEEEQKRLEGMSAEGRLHHEQSGVMDMMSRIRAKREQQLKEGINNTETDVVDPEEEKKKAKKAKKLEEKAKRKAYEERREAQRKAAAAATAAA